MIRKLGLAVKVLVLVVVLAGFASCAVLKLFPVSVTLDGADDWLETRVDVDDGERVRITATGEVSVNTDLYPTPNIPPDGDAAILGTPNEEDAGGAAGYPMPDELMGALVGKIGSNGSPFLIGSERLHTATTSGTLYLKVNDNLMTNNGGFFDVAIEYEDGIF